MKNKRTLNRTSTKAEQHFTLVTWFRRQSRDREFWKLNPGLRRKIAKVLTDLSN